MVTWDSEQYLRFKRERTQPARDLAMQLPPDDGSVTRVLDIGCGPGNSTAVLRERYPHAKILGVDSSPVMIETARKPIPTSISSCATCPRGWTSCRPTSTWSSPMPASNGCRTIRI